MHACTHRHTQTYTHSTHTQTQTHTHTHVTCEKSAKAGSANSGACPMSSWQTSGSGVYHGLDECLIYWVEWKTRNARPARKSRDDNRPATGLSWNPVHSFRYLEITSNCGILSSLRLRVYRNKDVSITSCQPTDNHSFPQKGGSCDYIPYRHVLGVT